MKLSNNFAYHVIYILLLPAFFMLFCFLYNPFDIQDYYQVGGKNFPFHFVMIFCIMLVCLLITRVILYFTAKTYKFLPVYYYLWCFFEIVFMSFFVALYTNLFYRGEIQYFTALHQAFRSIGTILVYPYFILILFKHLNETQEELKNQRESWDNSLIKFYDEHKRLKLTISPSAVLYISAEANYVKIHYLENDKVKDYLLRASMKSLESVAERHSLVRCHRSYFVNPRHINVLSRGSDGIITAEISEDGRIKIPVSKQYFEKLSDML